MSNTTTKLQGIVNLASTHVDLVPLAGVGGYSNEPALSICNDAIQELLCAPLDWKFNSVDMPMLVTTPSKQDYQFGGAIAFTLGATGSGVGIDLTSNNAITQSGTTTTVNTLEAHRFKVGDTVYMSGNTVAAFNSTFTDDGSTSTWSGGWVITAVGTKSFTFTHANSGLATSGAPGITDFGWLASATMVEMNNNSSPQNSRTIQAVRELEPWSRVSTPEKVCVLKDNGDGTLKIRFHPVPGSTQWGAKLVYQAKAPLKVALTDTWAPFPDEYGFVYRQAFLWAAYRYLRSPIADAEYAKLQQKVMKALGGADRETSDVYVTPAENLMDMGW
jgi:hypothetical protein